MSWRDRDYGYETYGAPGLRGLMRRPPAATLALLVAHGAAYILVLVLAAQTAGAAPRLMALSAESARPWAIASHPFAATSPLSLLFTLLALWSLGGRLELRLGVVRVLAVYLVAGLAAGGAFYGLIRVNPVLARAPLDYPVGALAAFCALAWSQLRHDEVQVFGRITSIAKVYAICGGIVVLLVVLGAGAGAAAWLAAAAVGAGCGVGLVAAVERLRVRPRRARPRHRRAARRPSAEPDIDPILAKISRSGLTSLTRAERAELEAARQAKLHRDA